MKKKLFAALALISALSVVATGCSSSNSGGSGEGGSAKLMVVGNPFSTELYGVGLPKDSAYCEQVNEAILEMIDDGTWKKDLDAEMKGVDYTPNADKNPPKKSDMTHCGTAGTFKTAPDGKITIGIKFDQPKLGYKQTDGTYTGFDVDVAKYVAGKLGFTEDQIVWKESVSSQRETMLEGHQVDMIFATYSITEERAEKVMFAGPYFVAGQDLLIREADKDKITGPESLTAETKLCSVSGSTPAENVKKNFNPDIQLVENTGYGECVQALIAGRVDAVTTDDIILAGWAAEASA
jgi:ABC-type amino acid transport substrate-binding protein